MKSGDLSNKRPYPGCMSMSDTCEEDSTSPGSMKSKVSKRKLTDSWLPSKVTGNPYDPLFLKWLCQYS